MLGYTGYNSPSCPHLTLPFHPFSGPARLQHRQRGMAQPIKCERRDHSRWHGTTPFIGTSPALNFSSDGGRGGRPAKASLSSLAQCSLAAISLLCDTSQTSSIPSTHPCSLPTLQPVPYTLCHPLSPTSPRCLCHHSTWSRHCLPVPTIRTTPSYSSFHPLSHPCSAPTSHPIFHLPRCPLSHSDVPQTCTLQPSFHPPSYAPSLSPQPLCPLFTVLAHPPSDPRPYQLPGGRSKLHPLCNPGLTVTAA